MRDKTRYSLQGHFHLTSHTGNGDVRGRMWQILDELHLSLSSQGANCRMQAQWQLQLSQLCFAKSRIHIVQSVTKYKLKSLQKLEMITYQGVDGARLDNYMRDVIKQDIPNALHCLA